MQRLRELRRLEAGTIAGLLVAVLAITLGLLLEGGHIIQVLQPTAAIIVLGGTLGAVLVQFPGAICRAAWAQVPEVFQVQTLAPRARMDELVRFAMQARRNGLVSLDAELKSIADPFFRKALMLAVDGISAREIRELLELELERLEEEEEQASRVWEAAGGFSPTIGILGAILGLIQVMQRLDDIGAVGQGIAVAFVATLYGVGFANLLFLPMAGKLRLRARERHLLRARTLEGVVAMVEGASPRTLREKLGTSAGERAPALVARKQALR